MLRSLRTERLLLRCWRDDDRAAFAAMNADVEVTADLGGPLSRSESDRKLDTYAEASLRHGYSRWVLEDTEGAFLGYTGVMHRRGAHPLGDHDEVGWRLIRRAWGHGYAVEAARASHNDVFTRIGLDDVFSYTAPYNWRSQAVMRCLGLQRDPAQDFVIADSKLGD